MQMNLADINNILQNIIGSNQHQSTANQNSVPNQQPMSNHASQLNKVGGNLHFQSLPQWQHPNNPTMNLLNATLQSLGRGPTPPTQTMGQYQYQYPVPSAQSNAVAVHALVSLSGILPQSPPLNTAPVASGMSTAASSQPNDMTLTPVLSLIQILQRFVDEENQRRVQVAILNAMLGTKGRISGQRVHNNNAARPQQVGAPPLSRQSLGSKNNNVAQPNQLGAPHPSVGSNVQADSIAAVLQAALRGDATAQPGENARAQNYGPVDDNNSDNEDDIDEESGEDEHHFAKRRNSSPDDEGLPTFAAAAAAAAPKEPPYSKNNTTNEPSSASATDSVPARQMLGLPSFAAAAAAAAPTDPPVKKKPRRAGFREQFLQQLRAMLDRESQNDSTTVQWSLDGSSFIIMDQLKFEEHIIPAYFDNPILLSSFLSKLYRWGFRRIPNERSDCYEFCLPTFKRLRVDSAPALTSGVSMLSEGDRSRHYLQRESEH